MTQTDANHLKITLEYANKRIKELEEENANLRKKYDNLVHEFRLLDEEHDLLMEEYMNEKNDYEELH
jgi:hypothetical protein